MDRAAFVRAFRRPSTLRYPAIVVFAGALSMAAGPVGTAEPADLAAPSTATATTSVTPAGSAVVRVHKAALAALRHDPIPHPLRPAIGRLRSDLADVGRCDYADVRHRLCRRGFATAGKVFVVLGDSHARHWIPALETVAKRTRYAAYYLAKPGCTAASVLPNPGHGPFVGCVEWRAWAIGAIRRLHPDVVLLTGAMPPGIVVGGRTLRDPHRMAARMRVGMVATIRALRGGADHIFVVSDPPGLAHDPRACLARDGADLGDCSSAPSRAAGLHFAADRAAAHRTRARLIDTRPWFCWQRVCPAVVGSTITYRGGGHLTTAYSRSLGRPLQRAMRLTQPAAQLSHG
jgi:hypothetical protein